MAAEPTTASSTNGASPAAAPADTMSPSDAFSRLEAAGIDELDDEPYEDLSDLGIDDELGAKGDDAEPAAEGAETSEADAEPKEDDAEKPKPEDALGLKGKGTREQPLRHKDLPADKFVKLKAPDGSEVVVSLKDAVSGTFMSRAMVDRSLSEADIAKKRAEGIAVKAVDHMKRSNDRLAATLRSPQGLVEALVEDEAGMRVLVEVARATARMIKNPQMRAEVVAELRAKRVAAQEQQLAQQRLALQQQEQEAAQVAQMQQTLAPAYKQGLKEAGILRPEQLTDELREGIRMRFNYLTQKHQRTPTGAELKLCIKSAVEELRAKGKLAAPVRPRAAPPVPETTTRPSNGKKDWSKVPEAQRMRDPAFLFDKAARKSVQRGA